MRKRGLSRMAAACALVALLVLEGLAGRLPLLNDPAALGLEVSRPGATPTATSLTQIEMNALLQYKAWLRAQPGARSRPAVSPDTGRAAGQCAQAIDTAYHLLPQPDGRLVAVVPGTSITATVAAHSDVNDPCMLYLAHELLFGSQPGPPHHPPAAAGSADPPTRQPTMSGLPAGGQKD